MRPFAFVREHTPAAAVQHAVEHAGNQTGAAFLGGGTTLMDLMKLDVARPDRLIDITGMPARWSRVSVEPGAIRLGAFSTMADAAADPALHSACPMIVQSLQLAASQQIRNMARLGGNVLQRTRCSYFRDVGVASCNKRTPGSGCAALDGYNREHAVLGGSDACVATYPGDFAQALIALDATVLVQGRRGVRSVPFANVHRTPGATPHIETTLASDDLLIGFEIASAPWHRRSIYLKVRERDSYAFAAASAAVALDLDGGRVRQVRIALGGVATRPWRAREAEQSLVSTLFDETSARRAAKTAFERARTLAHNAFKIRLGEETLVRALLQASMLEAA